jgi:hypothetical protein
MHGQQLCFTGTLLILASYSQTVPAKVSEVPAIISGLLPGVKPRTLVG